jgi:hypothetical protein
MNASVVDSIASRLRGEVGGLHIFRTTLSKCSFFDDLLTWTVNRSLISTTSLRLCFPQFPAPPPYRAINFRSHPQPNRMEEIQRWRRFTKMAGVGWRARRHTSQQDVSKRQRKSYRISEAVCGLDNFANKSPTGLIAPPADDATFQHN